MLAKFGDKRLNGAARGARKAESVVRLSRSEDRRATGSAGSTAKGEADVGSSSFGSAWVLAAVLVVKPFHAFALGSTGCVFADVVGEIEIIIVVSIQIEGEVLEVAGQRIVVCAAGPQATASTSRKRRWAANGRANGSIVRRQGWHCGRRIKR